MAWKTIPINLESEVMVIALNYCDLIMRVQWLNTLGSVLQDLSKLQMALSINSKLLGLRGDKTVVISLFSMLRLCSLQFLHFGKCAHFVVCELENILHVNANQGSVLTNKVTVKMEAFIMDGNTVKCGTVSGLTTLLLIMFLWLDWLWIILLTFTWHLTGLRNLKDSKVLRL